MTKEYLNQLYPPFKNRWKITISISIFIALFLLIFQPFGIFNYRGNNVLFEAGYGGVTFIVLIIDLFAVPFLLKPWFNTKKWTVLKQITWQIWILFSIGLGNFIYTSFFIKFSNKLDAFIVFQFYTLVVGFIPIVMLTILNQNVLLSANLKSANEFNASLTTDHKPLQTNQIIRITAENGKDKLDVELSHLLYITSTGNYIQVYYLKENQVKNMLLRSTMKQVEAQLTDNPGLFRCHRAFIVNIDKIVHVKGNSQGLLLLLNGVDEEITVSRNFTKSLKEQLDGRA